MKNLDKNQIKNINDLIEKDIRDLSTLIGKELSISLKKRAVKSLLQKHDKSKELLKIEAFEIGIELSLFDRLFSTSEKKFELAIEDSLKILNPYLQIIPLHEQSSSKPEFIGYLRDLKGKELTTIAGKFKICIECKSTKNLAKSVNTSTALEILKKCPENKYSHKIVIGTPSFEEAAKISAKEHNILLMPIFVYAKLLLLAKQNKINEFILASIFNENGELTISKLKEIIESNDIMEKN